MSIGRITYHKIKDYCELKKYKNFNIPIKIKNKWNLKCKDFILKNEFVLKSNIIDIFSEYCNDNLIYYYTFGNKKSIDKIYALSHDHSFDIVIEMLYEFPETFYIPDDCKKYYSQRELEFLQNIQKKLLDDGLKDVGTYYKEHPKKEKWEELYLEFNYDELRKRNIKVVQGVNIKKHEKMYKKITN